MNKPNIIKTVATVSCPCEGTRKDCRMCDGKGTYEDYHYFMEVNGVCYDGDTCK